MHEPLVVLAPFAQEETVVGGKHDGGVVELSHTGKRLEQLAHVLVGRHDSGIVILDHFLQGSGAVTFGLRVPGVSSNAIVGLGEGAWFAGISL